MVIPALSFAGDQTIEIKKMKSNDQLVHCSTESHFLKGKNKTRIEHE